MNVLILYATVEGQTAKIAGFAADEIRKLGHDAIQVDVDDTQEVSFEGIDAVVLAAPVHQRRHPRTFEALLVAQKRELEQRKTLLMSVSLSAAFPEGLAEAREYLVEMKMRTGFTPDAEILVAGAVRTSQYDYFAAQVVRHVVLRGKKFDPSAEEHEFTDWQALSSEISKFLSNDQGQ